MQKFNYYAPTKIVFGKDSELLTADNIIALGAKKVLMVYGGQSAEKSGLLGRIRNNFEENGLEYIELGGVVPNPLLSKVCEGIKKVLEHNIDFVLAVGGGSVIDSAKAIALGAANPEIDVWQFWLGKQKPQKTLPTASIVTIAAAGSETSNSSVITNDEGPTKTKRGMNNDIIRCKFAIMNPELTMSLPKYQIGAGVADIFMHTSERYFANILDNHLSDELAEGLFRTIIEYGPKGVSNPLDYEAMSEIMWCGSISHIGLTGLGSQGDTARAGDWSCHQLSMEPSAMFDSTHGAALSAVWGAWARYVLSANPERFAQFGEKVYGITEGTTAQKADQAIEKTLCFFQSLGMPTTLTELLQKEPDDALLNEMADNCSYQKTRTIGAFQILDRDDIYNIYKAAK